MITEVIRTINDPKKSNFILTFLHNLRYYYFQSKNLQNIRKTISSVSFDEIIRPVIKEQ
jgi:hypothetical protein